VDVWDFISRDGPEYKTDIYLSQVKNSVMLVLCSLEGGMTVNVISPVHVTLH